MEITASEMVLESQHRLLHLMDSVQIRDGSLLWQMSKAVYDLDRGQMDFYGSLLLEGEDGHGEND